MVNRDVCGITPGLGTVSGCLGSFHDDSCVVDGLLTQRSLVFPYAHDSEVYLLIDMIQLCTAECVSCSVCSSQCRFNRVVVLTFHRGQLLLKPSLHEGGSPRYGYHKPVQP